MIRRDINVGCYLLPVLHIIEIPYFFAKLLHFKYLATTFMNDFPQLINKALCTICGGLLLGFHLFIFFLKCNDPKMEY